MPARLEAADAPLHRPLRRARLASQRRDRRPGVPGVVGDREQQQPVGAGGGGVREHPRHAGDAHDARSCGWIAVAWLVALVRGIEDTRITSRKTVRTSMVLAFD